jgi:protease-4
VLSAALLLSIQTGSAFLSGGGTAAVIGLQGKITPAQGGPLSGGSLTPSDVRQLNDKALGQGADAIIYEINSPGGAAVASKEIHREIESVKKPTVCRMRDISASGGLIVAAACDKVVADRASVTGSLGVKLSYLEYSGLLKKLGVENVNISSGRYKSTGSRYKNITESEKEILQNISDNVHSDMIRLVSSERNLTENQTAEVATAKVVSGEQAKRLGLVDRLGGRRTALEAAEESSGKNLTIRRVQQSTGVFGSSLGAGTTSNLLKSLIPGLQEQQYLFSAT